MGREVNRLTARSVATIKKPGLHADGLGLYLVVEPGGAKRWSFIFQWNRKRKEMGLGATHTITLADARERAGAARKMVADGKNPIDERRRRVGQTFGEIADDVIAGKRIGWKGKKTEAGWKRSLEVHAKPLREMLPADVTTDDVLGVLNPIWTALPETAQKTRGRIEEVLDAANVKGLIPPPWSNPARWKGHLAKLMSKPLKLVRGHHSAMPYDQMPEFMAKLGEMEGVGAKALTYTILTAARTDETLAAHPEELNRKAKVWTVPAGRMKESAEHRIPLVEKALEAASSPGEIYLFPGTKVGRPLSNGTMERVLDRMGYGNYTVHGFRSTFTDWANDTTDFDDEVIQLALAHKVGGKVRRAYRRNDALEKRRVLMAMWEAFCYPALR